MKKSLSLTLTLLLFTAHTPVHAADWGTNLPNATEEKSTYLAVASKALLLEEQPTQENTAVSTQSVQQQKVKIDKEPTAPIEPKNPYDGILTPVPAQILGANLSDLFAYCIDIKSAAADFYENKGLNLDELPREHLFYVWKSLLGTENRTPNKTQLMKYVAFIDAFLPKAGQPTGFSLCQRDAFFCTPLITQTFAQIAIENKILLVLPSACPTLNELVHFRHHSFNLLSDLKMNPEKHVPIAFNGIEFLESLSHLSSGEQKEWAEDIREFMVSLTALGLLPKKHPYLDLVVLDFLVHHMFPKETSFKQSIEDEEDEKYGLTEFSTTQTKKVLTFVYHLLNKSHTDFLKLLHPELDDWFLQRLVDEDSAYSRLYEYFNTEWTDSQRNILVTLTKVQVDLGGLDGRAANLFAEQKSDKQKSKQQRGSFSRSNKK